MKRFRGEVIEQKGNEMAWPALRVRKIFNFQGVKP